MRRANNLKTVSKDAERLGMTKIKTFVKTVTVSIKLKDEILEDKIYFFSALPQTNERIKMNK